MSGKKIEWVIIDGNGDQAIGAVGFIGHQAVVVVAFYDDLDANKDGKVSLGERAAGMVLGMEGRAVAEVAMAARLDLDVIQRDGSFPEMAANLFVNFARGLVAEGVYLAYFSRGVGNLANVIAGQMTSSTVKQFVIRKGMEKLVKAAYDASVGS